VGELYPKGAGVVSIVVEETKGEVAASQTTILPAQQSPTHEHCFDLPSLLRLCEWSACAV
jgi:hypothetical protein